MKKVISLLLSVAMVLSLTAVEVMADDVETVTDDTETVADDVKVMTVDAEDAEKKENAVTLDLSQGSIVISATGYKQGGGDETPFTGAYTIKQSDKRWKRECGDRNGCGNERGKQCSRGRVGK